MKGKRKVGWIGGIVLGIAVVLILALIWVAMAVHKQHMKERIEAVMSADVALFAIGDPLYNTGDPLGNAGKEVALSEEEAQELRLLLGEIQETGYRTGEEKKQMGGAWDAYIKVRTATGETQYIWFTETVFYYMDGKVAVCFDPTDAEAYDMLYKKIQTMLRMK